VDDDDAIEREQTRYALRDGASGLIVAVVRLLLTHPIKLLQALALSVKMARRAERPLPVHFIYLAEACKILLWLREQHIVHLHAHFGTNSAEVAMLAHALGGPKWSFTVHGPEEFDKPHSIGLAEKIRRSAFVVAISSYGRSQLYRLVDHIYWPKVHVVRCGLDRLYLDDFPIQPAPPKRFVCVGRLCEQKGQLLLLEAARILAAEGMDFELVLAGDGEMRTEIETFIDSHRLQFIVRVTGWISSVQVRSELLAARALVLPSFAECLPVVIVEAMALRRPIISTFVAGIPELVRSEEHGWLVPAGDVKALVEAMRACIQAPEDELTAMGDAARERVLRFHDANNEATKLGKLFQAIASGHRFRASEDAAENNPLSDPSPARTPQELPNS